MICYLFNSLYVDKENSLKSQHVFINSCALLLD